MNAQFNSNQPENQIISEVMSDATKGNNRRARFIVMMFENEVSYSKDAIANVFRKTGNDRTEVIEETLQEISDSYSQVWEQRETLKARKADKAHTFTTAEALQLEGVNAKLKSAAELYKGALTAVYHLRKIEAFGLKLTKTTGALSYFHYVVNDDGTPELDPKGNPVSNQQVVSGNALVRAGNKDIDTDFGSKRQQKKNGAPNAARDGIAPVADVVTNRIRKVRAEGKNVDEGSDDEVKALDSLLHELIVAYFADDRGVIDRLALMEYVEQEFANTANNGKDKPKEAKAEAKAEKAA